MKRMAFYGGSFDPLHNGHLLIAQKLTELFALDEFFFIPAFHAPHKKNKKPSSAFHRFAMISMAINNEPQIKISTIELDAPERPFTFETQTKLLNELSATEIFFVIGADSWQEITTWREWEKVLSLTNVIVVTRPDFEVSFSHVTENIRTKIVDLRNSEWGKITDSRAKIDDSKVETDGSRIYITDAVFLDVSATEIRQKIRAGEKDWCELVPPEIAKYIEKYELYI